MLRSSVTLTGGLSPGPSRIRTKSASRVGTDAITCFARAILRPESQVGEVGLSLRPPLPWAVAALEAYAGHTGFSEVSHSLLGRERPLCNWGLRFGADLEAKEPIPPGV